MKYIKSSDLIINNPNLSLIIRDINYISKKLKTDLDSKSWRLLLFDKCGPSAFIIPDRLLLPIKNPLTEKYDCRLIYHSLLITMINEKYNEYYLFLKDLQKKINCIYKYNIIIDNTFSYDLLEFLEIQKLL